MSEKIAIAISGAAGRMGRRLIALGSAEDNLKIAAAWDSPSHPDFGADSGQLAGIGPNGVPIRSITDDQTPVDVIIDFSTPAATDELIAQALKRRSALVYATTGAAAGQMEALRQAAKTIPVLWSPSMSMTVNLTMLLAQTAARALADKDADVEIIEKHHRFKADAPSGTALKFGRLIAEEMGIDGAVFGREGKTGARPHNQIGYHAVRIGDNPGEHTILFGLLGETIELTVKATNRDAYAVGALRCAEFLAGKPAGEIYSMNDVLNL